MHKLLLILFLNLVCCGVLPAQTVDTVVTEVAEPEEYFITDTDTSLYFADHPFDADTVTAWKNAKAFGYAKYLDSLLREEQRKKKPPEQEVTTPVKASPSSTDSFLSSQGVSVLLWILAGAFVLFILYKLFLAEAVFKKAARKEKGTAQPEVAEEQITPESDFDRLIRQALGNGNYRLAIRYHYLRSLHLLAEKQYVEMAADKTNYQYVQEIGNEQLRNTFASLTLNYDYVWYGEFQPDQVVYYKLEQAFTAFNQKV